MAPSLEVEPRDIGLTEGDDLVLTVTAEGWPLTYQWQLNGANLIGATSPRLVLRAVEVDLSGSYSVVVANMLGAVTSVVAQVTVQSATPMIWAPTPSFAPALGAGSNFRSVAALGDGKVLAFGTAFSPYGTRLSALLRFNTNGTTDSQFYAADRVGTELMALQPDGRIMMGGTMLYRLLPNGSPDGSFTPVSFPPGGLAALAIQPDGEVLVVGSFQSVQGVARKGLARFRTNGQLDPTFVPGEDVGGSAPPMFSSVAVVPDERVVVGGLFSPSDGHVRRALNWVKADGQPETNLRVEMARVGAVRALLAQSDSMLAGGDFIWANGAAAQRLVRLDTSGGRLGLSCGTVRWTPALTRARVPMARSRRCCSSPQERSSSEAISPGSMAAPAWDSSGSPRTRSRPI